MCKKRCFIVIRPAEARGGALCLHRARLQVREVWRTSGEEEKLEIKPGRIRKTGNSGDQLESRRSIRNSHLLFTAFNCGYVFDLGAKTGDLPRRIAQVHVPGVREAGEQIPWSRSRCISCSCPRPARGATCSATCKRSWYLATYPDFQGVMASASFLAFNLGQTGLVAILKVQPYGKRILGNDLYSLWKLTHFSID